MDQILKLERLLKLLDGEKILMMLIGLVLFSGKLMFLLWTISSVMISMELSMNAIFVPMVPMGKEFVV